MRPIADCVAAVAAALAFHADFSAAVTNRCDSSVVIIDAGWLAGWV